jgi:hypothetical protein
VSQTKITGSLRQQVFDVRQNPRKPSEFRCDGCGNYFVRSALQVDHIVPEAESRPEDRSNPDNLQLLCYPRHSTRWNSCHKKKTYEEHQRRARANRPRKDWGPFYRRFVCSSIVIPATVHYWTTGEQSAIDWTVKATLINATAFSIYLVQKGLRERRPRRVISPEPEPLDEPGQDNRLDLTRIVEATREVVGAKGDVTAVGSGDRFSLSYAGTGFADHESDKRWNLQEKITAKIGDRWIVEWDTASDKAVFTRRPPLPKKIHHPGLDPKRKWHVLPVAEGAEFDLLVTPHILMAGETMSGKTAMMRAMVIAASHSAATNDNVEMNLLDPKQIEMIGFQGWPGVKEIVTDPHELWAFAIEMKEEMDRRYREVKSGRAVMSQFKKIINFWDEQEEFYNAMLELWQSGEKDADGEPYKRSGERVPRAVRAVASLLAMSRRCGIHNVIATQSPDAMIFGKSGVRQNMPGRASVGAIDGIRAGWLYGDSSVGRDIPSNAKGRATIQIGDGKPFEVQTFWVPDPSDGDANYDNGPDDWATLLRLGMPTVQLPEKFTYLLEAA